MFALSKWYCDCVTGDGAAFMGYWARLRWGLLRVPYAAILRKSIGESPIERTYLRRSPPPTLKDGALSWPCPELGFRGEWLARRPGYRHTLLDSANGSITWSCEMPSADTQIELAGAGSMTGLGYAEHLSMSVKPWRLPFDELRWGRFLSAEHAITWIAWSGGATRQWAFYNGVEVPDPDLGAEVVALPAVRGVLALGNVTMLRDGPLMSTALRHLPAKRLWLGGRLDDAHETKWLARGTFSFGDRRVSGWAIHEVVRLR